MTKVRHLIRSIDCSHLVQESQLSLFKRIFLSSAHLKQLKPELFRGVHVPGFGAAVVGTGVIFCFSQ